MDVSAKKKSGSFLMSLGRRAGIGLHLSSLPGAYGIGDIGEGACAFIDRLVEMGIGAWQFLPLGPTAYGDSPYQPLSAFAGNANLISLGPLQKLGLVREADLQALAALPGGTVDYGRLIPAKRAVLDLAAERFSRLPGNGLLAEYDDFLHEHAERWLDDYALFRVLKSAHGERPWPDWTPEYMHRQPHALSRARNDHRESIERTRIVQFLFDRQWRALKAYAGERDVCLFGDMPIYIALDSSDAWAHPELLCIDRDGRPAQVAGVPPDYFSQDGQLWGNPLYDWPVHQRNGYRWWVERVRHAARQAHLVRIDHFRGFESYWAVPATAQTARDGAWQEGPGSALFDAIEKALGRLPIVAEDLGVITPDVVALRERHDLPGMVVLQFEVADPDFDPGAIERNCVCYTGTHDNDTTAGWFRGNGDDTRTAAEIEATRRNVLKLTGGSATTVHRDLLRLAFESPAELAVAPMQDVLGLGSEARLNTPGTTWNNWRWRLREEDLHCALAESLSAVVDSAARRTPAHK